MEDRKLEIGKIKEKGQKQKRAKGKGKKENEQKKTKNNITSQVVVEPETFESWKMRSYHRDKLI